MVEVEAEAEVRSLPSTGRMTDKRQPGRGRPVTGTCGAPHGLMLGGSACVEMGLLHLLRW